MIVKHKTFLKWLLYIVVVIFAAVALTFFGIPQLTLRYDHIYLGSALFLMYLGAEVLSALQAVRISRENVIANDVARWLTSNNVVDVIVNDDDRVEFEEKDGDSLEVQPSIIAGHLRNLITKVDHSGSTEQRILLDGLIERVYFDTLIGDFIGSRVVWIGILATILGVIMAFWPFVSIDGVNIEQIRSHLGPFFRGVAVAFLPTAVSFVCKIALDFNTRILSAGINELLDTVTVVSETYVIPLLEHRIRAETKDERQS